MRIQLGTRLMGRLANGCVHDLHEFIPSWRGEVFASQKNHLEGLGGRTDAERICFVATFIQEWRTDMVHQGQNAFCATFALRCDNVVLCCRRM